LGKDKLLLKIQNNQKNIRFATFISLIKAFGFTPVRTKGSHHIFERADIFEMVNVQDDNGKAKPYQIKQFLSLVEKYDLRLEGLNE